MARKKTPSEEEPVGDPFIVLFTALSVIMLAFFILLNSMSVTNPDKKRKALGSLMGVFGTLPGGKSPPPPGILDTVPIVEANPDVSQLLEELGKIVELNGIEGNFEISIRDEDIVFSFENNILFEENSVVLTTGGINVLENLRKRLAQSNTIISVEGHTSPESYKETPFESDWEFASKRSSAISDYFLGKGFAENRLRLACFGTNEPVRPNDTEFGRSRNRRTEIVAVSGLWDPDLRPKIEIVVIGEYIFSAPVEE